MKKNCWEEMGWERGERIRTKEGNQSHAFFARKKSDPAGDFNYVLKKLRRQDDDNRRAMFYVETVAVNALSHRGILPIEATNAESYKDAVELFLITKKAQGEDLEDLVARGIDFQTAVRIVIGVLDILAHCHSQAVVHRDIKPCHVIAPADNPDSPTLIDFGLAHCEDQPSEAETKSDQGKGNRFLIGPEHLPGTGLANRSSATDICQCIGLLFFALTKKYPGSLRDADERKPHQRDDIQFSKNLEQWQRETLELIFDKAFEWHPDKRWNDTQSLIDRLRQLLEQKQGRDDTLRLRVAKALRDANVEAKASLRAQAESMSDNFSTLISKTCSCIDGETKEHLTILFVPPNRGAIYQGNPKLLSQFLISLDRPRHRALVVMLATELVNSRFTVTLNPHTGDAKIFSLHQPINLGSCEVGDSEGMETLRAKLEDKLLACVEDMLSD